MNYCNSCAQIASYMDLLPMSDQAEALGVSPNLTCEKWTCENYGSSLLFWVVESCATNAVDALLRRGGDPNLRNAKGDTPCSIAITNGHLPILKLLHQAGAKLTTDMISICNGLTAKGPISPQTEPMSIYTPDYPKVIDYIQSNSH